MPPRIAKLATVSLTSGPAHCENFFRCMAIILRIAQIIDSTFVHEQMRQLRLVERMIKGAQEADLIVRPHRRLVRREMMTIASEKRYLWLFTDLLIASKQLDKAGISFEYKYQMELADCKVTQLAPEHKQAGRGFMIEYPSRCYLVLSEKREQLAGWVSDLRDSIHEHQHGVFGAPLKRILDRERAKVPSVVE
ncbi:MAG: hypothetical protein Q8P67_14290, partial [archaeon]|nr:hypothetical protein [archaeon]